MSRVARRAVLAWAGALAAGVGKAAPLAPAAAPPLGSGKPATPQRVTLRAAALSTDGTQLRYDGTAAGPVIRLRKGAGLSLALVNGLAGPTSLQWHGLRAVMAIADAWVADRVIAPGEATTQVFVPPDSGLSLFRPAFLAGLPDQAAAGLFGALVVEETDPPVVDRDLLLTLSEGTGGALAANGGPAPLRDTIATGGRLRLRLVNATSGRILVVGVEGARPKVIAIDGQPCELFAPVRDAVPIAPGARFELMMDASPTAGSALRLFWRRDPSAGLPDPVLLDLVTAGAARSPLPPIAALPRNPALPQAIALERAVRADLVIAAVPDPKAGEARWRLGARAALTLPASPLITVPRGRPVVFGFDNRAAVPVPVRVHGQAMRLLHAHDDGWEPYWRDGVILPPASVTHVAFLADTTGRWLIESACFDQASSGLRTWFAVV